MMNIIKYWLTAEKEKMFSIKKTTQTNQSRLEKFEENLSKHV